MAFTKVGLALVKSIITSHIGSILQKSVSTFMTRIQFVILSQYRRGQNMS